MAKFKDCTGREWGIEIPNFGVVAKLRAETALDLNKIGHETEALVDVLHGDSERLLGVAWSLVKNQVPPIAYEQFLDVIDGAALGALRLALIDAALDFFHHGTSGPMKNRLREILIPTPSGSKNSDGNSPVSAG